MALRLYRGAGEGAVPTACCVVVLELAGVSLVEGRLSDGIHTFLITGDLLIGFGDYGGPFFPNIIPYQLFTRYFMGSNDE